MILTIAASLIESIATVPTTSVTHRPLIAVTLATLAIFAACDGGPTEPDTPAPEITTTELPPATVGEPYSEGITVTGGNGEYFWEIISGSLPQGLEFNVDDLTPEDAFITGTPEHEAQASFRVTVEDGHGRADTVALTLTVTPVPEEIVVETLRLPPALAEWVYGVELLAAGGDGTHYEWEIVEGSLPAGMELTSEGRFTGGPAETDTVTFTVEVSSGGFTARRTYTLEVIAEQRNRFTITPYAVVDVEPELQAMVEEAIRRWEEAVTGDLSSGTLPGGDNPFFASPSSCGGFGQLVNGAAIDDIMILVNIDSIDGPGKVLGQAGPCAVRGDTLPLVGLLTMDEDDLLGMTEATATHVIQHEIAHIMGFGTLWDDDWFGFVEPATDTSVNDPHYFGASAVAAYQEVVETATSIPVENTGGEGTRGSHWRESVFDRELMTGFAESDMFLSAMSIAAFEDLGYEVNLAAADDASLRSIMMSALRGDAEWTRIGHDIAGAPGPIVVLLPDGTHRTLRGTGLNP